MEDLLRIAQEAEKILDITSAVFQENGIPLPERRFLAIGETAHDCEQVTVSFASAGLGMPGDGNPQRQSCSAASYNATFNIEIVRKTPQGTKTSGGVKYVPPKATDLQAYGVPRMIDSWLLIKIAQKYEQTTLSRSSTYTVVAGPDSGGMQAIVLTLSGQV